MVLPSTFTSFTNLHYYQGVLLAEVFLTLFLYTLLKIIHYIKWGHDDQTNAAEKGEAKTEEVEQSKKWDQKAWDVYFPIIFTNHIGAIAMILVYIPYVYAIVMGFMHFICFLALIILNICIKDAQPGNGSRTKGSRVVWGIMCVINLMLLIGGLSGVGKVYL